MARNKPIVADATEQPVIPAPITKERLRICCDSARYWAVHLPSYANSQQSKADAWAIAAGVLAAITSLAIFPTAKNSQGISVATVLIAVAAFLSAAFALVPRVKNYGEMAGKAREIASTYGHLQGELMDAQAELEADAGNDPARQRVVKDFEAARAKKNELRNLPPRDQC